MVYDRTFSGNRSKDVTLAQITSISKSPSIGVTGLSRHTFQFTMVGLNLVSIEGSLDNVNFFTLPAITTGTTGWIAGGNETFANSADGTFIVNIENANVKFIRVDVNVIGTSVDAIYHGES